MILKFLGYLPNVPTGMKNEPIIPPMIMINLIAQKPFCIPALGSFEVLTLIIINVHLASIAKTLFETVE